MPGFTSPLAEQLAADVLGRFERYVRVDTTSELDRRQSPSTPGQLELGRRLVAELEEIGLRDVEQDANGYVFGSGDTLLGADDKAGIAEIVGAVAHLARHPELPRPTLRVGFLPDEEIGMGPALLDVERLGARCAYTLDGSTRGELQAESFTAAGIRITVHGVDIHPGYATGKMVNAVRLAGRILAQ